MSKMKRAEPLTDRAAIDWGGTPLERVEHAAGSKIFSQGEPALSVMYVLKGSVRLSVVSHAGKEAVIAVLNENHFFGEGCLVGQPHRMSTASALAPCTIVVVQSRMVQELHARPPFADRFLTHMLTRNIRIEEDLIDQLFNSSEKRLARTLLLLARFGEPDVSHRSLAESVQGDARRDDRDDALARELFHEQVPEAGLHRLQRRPEDQQLTPQRRAARLNARRRHGLRPTMRSGYPRGAERRRSDSGLAGCLWVSCPG